MLKRPHYIALALVGLLVLLLLNVPSRTAGQLKLAIGSFFLPLFGLNRSTHTAAHQVAEVLVPRKELQRELEEARRANEEFRVRTMQYDAMQRENDRLRQLVGWARQMPWKLRLANVISRDPANWWKSAQIDLGSNDGIKLDMPVLTMSGLVGRVSEVSLTHSRVELVGSPTCRVAAMIKETGETGVILGNAGPLDNALVNLSYLSSNARLKPGMTVVTSEYSTFFPRGIVIGQVAEDSRRVEFGLYSEARVKLSANIGSLEEVWVLTQ